MYRKKSQYSIYQQKERIIFSIYTHTHLKNISKANSFSHLVTEVKEGWKNESGQAESTASQQPQADSPLDWNQTSSPLVTSAVRSEVDKSRGGPCGGWRGRGGRESEGCTCVFLTGSRRLAATHFFLDPDLLKNLINLSRTGTRLKCRSG